MNPRLNTGARHRRVLLCAALAIAAAGCTPGDPAAAGGNGGGSNMAPGAAAGTAAGTTSSACIPQGRAQGRASRRRVTHVIDGDTFVIDGGDRVRIIGINTPELNRDGRPEPLARQARDALLRILGPGDPVELIAGVEARDRHGRLLAHAVSGDGRNAAAELLNQGLAFAIAVPPNLTSADCYARLDAASRANGRGVYGEPYFDAVTPDALRGARGGFRRVTGRVTRASTGRYGVWIDLDGGLTVKVDAPDMAHFPRGFFDRLDGRRIEARGWIYSTDKGLRIKAHHPAELALLGPP